ncbi:hypothetical protein SEA_FRANSOYER_44 [Microbacterium phage Fransoyer]|nr:hypothetical protein SEA_RUBYRALPH_44 [Microbacterium phage RubyRalph]QUE25593.1 hypothetical protein SEA_SADLAD_46 [Microbacterium phage SadLad]UUG69609.1 hypothetical protein SEA_FRANSOYER_44 [Microbacterium phage Fransoyer]
MNEHEKDRRDLAAAQAAIQTAKLDAIKTDVVVEKLHRSTNEIRSLVQENGYVNRFRQVLRGA